MNKKLFSFILVMSVMLTGPFVFAGGPEAGNGGIKEFLVLDKIIYSNEIGMAYWRVHLIGEGENAVYVWLEIDTVNQMLTKVFPKGFTTLMTDLLLGLVIPAANKVEEI